MTTPLSRAALALLVSLAACAPSATPAPPAPAPTSAPASPAFALPPEIRWVTRSAEHRAIFLQTYRAATERLEALARGREPGTWAVILDADETVLDNATYQAERARAGQRYTEESWIAWVRRREATALPGAVPFTRRVRELGGRVAIVTNRAAAVCDDTRANLAAVGVVADLVLCQPEGAPGDKNPRFRAVAEGTAEPGVPPLAVLLWVGDNVQDFPGLTQAARTAPVDALAEFGRSWFLLPNPMYGSWERVPE